MQLFKKIVSSHTVRIFLLLFACTILACSLFPLLWQGLHTLYGDTYSYSPGRTFRRIWQITILIGLISCSRWIGLQPPNRVGYDWNVNSLRNALIGTAVVWTFLFGLSLSYYYTGIWVIHPYFNGSELVNEIVEGLLRGLLVAGLEEYIFRGLIFLSFCRTYSWWKAAVYSSFIFAALHFLQGRGLAAYESAVTWSSGFTICGGLLQELIQSFNVFPNATGLFLVGLILCYAFHRTGTIWFSIGLHGGWVCFASFYANIWQHAHGNSLWFGEYRLYDGIVPMTAMLIIFPISALLLHYNVLYKKRGLFTDSS